MRIVLSGVAAAALALSSVLTASAQMVVDRNSGERVEYPFDTGAAQSFRPDHRRHNPRSLRITVIQGLFPEPQPFGWFTCCL